jgi:hypothetical protein
MNKFDKICRRISFKNVRPEWKPHIKNSMRYQELCIEMSKYDRLWPDWRHTKDWASDFLAEFFKYENKANRAEEIVGEEELKRQIRLVNLSGYGGSF